jgi:hypothetical protein
MEYLSVRNFEHFQHYKDRAPTWIKLYNAVMDDEAFLELSDAERGQLVLIWLLASRRDNKLPRDGKLIARAIQASGRVNVERFVESGFLVPYQPASEVLAGPEHIASVVLAEPVQSASPHARPRAHGEREKRREEKKEPSAGAVVRPPRESWVADGVALWQSVVGTVPHGEFGKALKPMIDLHGWPAVRPDLDKWLRERAAQGKPCRPTWYAGEVTARLAPKPKIRNDDGTLTEYGERLTRPDKVPA